MGMEYPVKAALRADVQPLIGQGWHDLPWRQCRADSKCVTGTLAGVARMG
jgi:hypothetical protein